MVKLSDKQGVRNAKAHNSINANGTELNKSETSLFGVGVLNQNQMINPSEMVRKDTYACCCCVSYNCGGAVAKTALK
ncbi:MAG: hypothetical protein LKH79_23810 [Heyndrickxia oleronia]|jgi:hypothetical protein|uniref:hypothetical protein n=1 Tax=Heyndrickxia oleronia TaxID=38875 RepID=UPI00242E14F5|nr:hypothetical protein [Heyndrickxia oleronia]MCI1593504.1 hypothetical protein [Heyndrickxia oleronia]